MLGAALGLGLKYVAPKLIAEGATSLAARKGATVLAGRAMNFAAGATGQRVITQVAGPRVAAAVTKPTGQFVGKKLLTMDISQRIQGEGKYGDPGTTKTTKPMTSSTSTADPYGSSLKPTGPSVNVYPSGPSVDVSDRPPSGKDIINQYQQRRAARRGQRGGAGPTGWMGTGKGWWQQNEQVNFGQAFSDPTKMDSFDVARGPTRSVLPLPGRKIGQGIKRGVKEGVAGAMTPEAEPAKFDTDMLGKQIGVPSMPTTPTAPSTAPAPKVAFPTSRTESFDMGTQTTSPEPVSAPKISQRTAAPSPGLGDYGKDRFKKMMTSRDISSPY